MLSKGGHSIDMSKMCNLIRKVSYCYIFKKLKLEIAKPVKNLSFFNYMHCSAKIVESREHRAPPHQKKPKQISFVSK